VNSFLLLIVLLATSFVAFAQTAAPYAVWQDPNSNNYYFVRINAATGVKTNIQVIPGMTAFVAGNKTTFNTDSNYYYVTGLSGATSRLYTIDVSNGNTVYNPVMSANVVGLEYNCNDSSLYGLRVTGNNYDLVKVNPVNGSVTGIGLPVGINGYVGGSFSLDRVQQLYNFVALVGNTYFLQCYRLPSGNMVYNNPLPGNIAGHRYSCADSAVYALRETGNQYLLLKISLNNGLQTIVSALTGVTPGIVAESSTVNAAGEYVYRGFNSTNQISVITINLSTGATINAVATNDNAAGFEEGICCYDTSGTTVSLSEYTPSNIIIFPFSEYGFIHIESTIKKFFAVRVMDVRGTLIDMVSLSPTRQYQFHSSSLASGTYFIELIFDDGTSYTKKLIRN
jgi:hypothetical protein